MMRLACLSRVTTAALGDPDSLPIAGSADSRLSPAAELDARGQCFNCHTCKMHIIFDLIDTGMNSDSGQSASGQTLNHYPLLGLPEIDSQHHDLFVQFDRLIDKPESHPVAEPFLEILSQLGRQIDAHFLSEESILKTCGMPPEELAEHLSAHEEILEEYTRLNLDLMAGKAIGQQSILEMIRRWIVDHIHQHDSRIRHYLSLSRDQG